MNDPYSPSGSESPRGTSMLGPAVPPRDSADRRRRSVIDGAAGPFLGRERQAPGGGNTPQEQTSGSAAEAAGESARGDSAHAGEEFPWVTPEHRGSREAEAHPDGDTAPEARGDEIIASGLLGDADVVPIESLAPEAGAGDVHGGHFTGSGASDTVQASMSGEDSVREHEARMAEPAGAVDDRDESEQRDHREQRDPDTSWPPEEEAYAGFGEEDGWEVNGSGELRSESGEAESHPAAEAAPDPGSEMPSTDASGDGGAAYAGGGAGFGEDPYWEPWVEPSGSDAAVGGGEAVTAWEAAAMGGEGFSGMGDSTTASDDEEAAANLATPLLNEAIPGASTAVLEEIAARLERIARSLRSRDGDEVGGDSLDPLEVLITGYALGYSEGVKSVGGSRRDEP